MESIDPRIEAVSSALLTRRDMWVTLADGEVQFDTDIAAIVALAALDDFLSATDGDYCRWDCHTDERQEVLRQIDAFAEESPDTAAACGQIRDMLEADDLPPDQS